MLNHTPRDPSLEEIMAGLREEAKKLIEELGIGVDSYGKTVKRKLLFARTQKMRKLVHMFDQLLKYDLGTGVEAFSTQRDAILPYRVIQGHQIHGCKVAVVEQPILAQEDLEGYDAFVTNLPGIAIGVRTADCIPVLLYDPVKRVVAAVHAGWKGTVLHISQKAIDVMSHRFGCNPRDMMAALGPGIGPDSFQVGEEVAEHFKNANFPIEDIWSFQGAGNGMPMSGGHHIDLWKANRWLLEQAGILKENIQIAGIDTFTTVAYFSARREGIQCGRIINAIKLI